MRDIVSKLPRSNRGQPDLDTAEQHVRWPFFKPMLFMVDEFLGSGNSKDTSSNGIFNHDLQAVKEETLSSVDQHETESDGESMLSLPLDGPEQGAGPTITTAMRAPAGVSGAQSQSRLMHEPPAKRTRNGTGETFLSFEGLHQLKTLFSSSQEEKRQSLPQPQDECQTFCDAIAFDLRKLEDPLLMMQVKRDIYSIVNSAVMEQLQQSRNTGSFSVNHSIRCQDQSNSYSYS